MGGVRKAWYSGTMEPSSTHQAVLLTNFVELAVDTYILWLEAHYFGSCWDTSSGCGSSNDSDSFLGGWQHSRDTSNTLCGMVISCHSSHFLNMDGKSRVALWISNFEDRIIERSPISLFFSVFQFPENLFMQLNRQIICILYIFQLKHLMFLWNGVGLVIVYTVLFSFSSHQ